MKYLAIVVALTGLIPADAVRAQDQQIRAALEAARPGVFHKKLNAWVGTWSTSWQVWHGPGQPPSDKATGTATFRPILGGRFIEGVYTGKGILKMSFEGRLTFGFDHLKRHYTATWMNTFETGVAIYEGAPAEGEPAATPLTRLTLIGRPSPHPKIAAIDSRATFTFADPDRIIEEQFATDPEGREFKAVEVIYTRNRR